jgi:hypothetical protein
MASPPYTLEKLVDAAWLLRWQRSSLDEGEADAAAHACKTPMPSLLLSATPSILPAMPFTPADLYDRDFYAWTRHQARELRRLRALRLNTALDLVHLALEVRDLGSEQLFAIQSQMERLIEHLLKLEYSTHEAPRRQWMISVNSARSEIERRMTATLRRKLNASLPKLYEVARRNAALALEDHGEAAAACSLPLSLPYTLEKLLDAEWLPLWKRS